jgi:hypothetical protein
LTYEKKIREGSKGEWEGEGEVSPLPRVYSKERKERHMVLRREGRVPSQQFLQFKKGF